MKPIDRMGFGPTREVTHDGEGGYIVMVTPPKLLGPKPTVHVNLTADQFRRYQQWERGMLMTGLSDEDFHKFTRSDEE